jgi:sulfite exporter TauE/SafE
MWYTALFMGLAGSLHCLGMCTPLVLLTTGKSTALSTKRLIYNSGRIVTYGLQGALVSSFGSLLDLAGVQQSVSITLGVLLVLAGIAGTTLRISFLSVPLQKFTLFLKSSFAHFLSIRSPWSTAALGMLNGILPCGLTYVALAYCITLPSTADGFLFMVIFGSGTLPVMLGVTSLFQIVVTKLKLNFRLITTSTLIVVGTLLVARTYMSHKAAASDGVTICR